MKWHPQLQCAVANLLYDFTSQTGTLNMGEEQCCDMSACIALFTAIAQDVQRIDTFAGDRPDTTYTLSRGEWRAVLAQ